MPDAIEIIDGLIAQCDEREAAIPPSRGLMDLAPMGHQMGVIVRREILKEVRRKVAEAGAPIVLCLRDPDYDNEFMVFGNVKIHDIDLGRSNLRDPEEFAMWAESHESSAAELEAEGCPEAAAYIREVISNADPDRED